VRIARAGRASLIALAAMFAVVALIAMAGLIAMAALLSAPALAQSSPLSGSYQPQAAVADESDDAAEVPAHLRRQTVSYSGNEAAGTIIIDTPNTYLYYVLGGGKAIRYGIGVGREGFTWSGVKTVERKGEWPDWVPPAEMIERQPYLPRFVAGGPGNPLGARAMYLSGSVYRIHGTNQPSSIGKRVSSGCIRMVNDDVIDLYSRVSVGAKVVVLPMTHRAVVPVAQAKPAPAPQSLASAYAPASAPAAAWQGIRMRGVY
jgi:lipoprotein-anchoring transpeptidase ErfK/SrfK